MKCSEVLTMLDAYANGAAPAIAGHLTVCATCRREARMVEALTSKLKADKPELPEGLEAKTFAALGTARSGSSLFESLKEKWMNMKLTLRYTCCAVLACIGLGGVIAAQALNHTPSTDARDLAGAIISATVDQGQPLPYVKDGKALTALEKLDGTTTAKLDRTRFAAYELNKSLLGVYIERVKNPTTTPLLFDRLRTVNGKVIVAYLDGHVAYLSTEDWKKAIAVKPDISER